VDYSKRVTGMMTDKLVAVSQSHDSNYRMATDQFSKLLGAKFT